MSFKALLLITDNKKRLQYKVDFFYLLNNDNIDFNNWKLFFVGN